MPKYYKATFSDGTVVRRGTTHREYSHAWLARRKCHPDWVALHPDQPTSQSHGFSATETNAGSQLRRYTFGEMVFAEVVPAIEITSAEYRSIKR